MYEEIIQTENEMTFEKIIEIDLIHDVLYVFYDSSMLTLSYIQLLFTKKKQLEDSKKLSYQKRVLLNQVKTGHPIDYTKIKVLKKEL